MRAVVTSREQESENRQEKGWARQPRQQGKSFQEYAFLVSRDRGGTTWHEVTYRLPVDILLEGGIRAKPTESSSPKRPCQETAHYKIKRRYYNILTPYTRTSKATKHCATATNSRLLPTRRRL